MRGQRRVARFGGCDVDRPAVECRDLTTDDGNGHGAFDLDLTVAVIIEFLTCDPHLFDDR
jgi:hypothetical protein